MLSRQTEPDTGNSKPLELPQDYGFGRLKNSVEIIPSIEAWVANCHPCCPAESMAVNISSETCVLLVVVSSTHPLPVE